MWPVEKIKEVVTRYRTARLKHYMQLLDQACDRLQTNGWRGKSARRDTIKLRKLCHLLYHQNVMNDVIMVIDAQQKQIQDLLDVQSQTVH